MMKTKQPAPRPEITHLPSVPHGAPDYRELEQLGYLPDQVIDFSVNSNPYGPPPGIDSIISQVPVDRYPDREAIALRRKLSTHHQVPYECILAGNGSAELLQLIAIAYLSADSRILISGPTFGEYQKSAVMMGADVTVIRAKPTDEFQPNLNSIQQSLVNKKIKFVYLCNPNNPTGQLIDQKKLAELIMAHPQTLFVIDEAYLTFTQNLASSLNTRRPNQLVLRSMTKDYSLAGLRLGYAIGNKQVIQAISSVRPPWNVNAIAQAVGIHVLSDATFIESTMEKIWQAKTHLLEELVTLGYTPVPSNTHFFLLPVGDASAFRSALLQKGIQVRDCTSFGLPSYVRISTLTPEKNQQLIQAIKDL